MTKNCISYTRIFDCGYFYDHEQSEIQTRQIKANIQHFCPFKIKTQSLRLKFALNYQFHGWHVHQCFNYLSWKCHFHFKIALSSEGKISENWKGTKMSRCKVQHDSSCLTVWHYMAANVCQFGITWQSMSDSLPLNDSSYLTIWKYMAALALEFGITRQLLSDNLVWAVHEPVLARKGRLHTC